MYKYVISSATTRFKEAFYMSILRQVRVATKSWSFRWVIWTKSYGMCPQCRPQSLCRSQSSLKKLSKLIGLNHTYIYIYKCRGCEKKIAVRSLQKRTHWPNTLKHSKLQGHQVQNESAHVTLNGIMLPKLQYVTWKTMKSREKSPSTNYCWKSATFTSLKTLKTSVSEKVKPWKCAASAKTKKSIKIHQEKVKPIKLEVMTSMYT